MRVHPEGANAVRGLHTRASDQPHHQSNGAIQAGADSGGTTTTSAIGEYIIHLQAEGRAADRHSYDPDGDPPRRHLRIAQPDRVRPGHELRFGNLRFRAGRRERDGHARRGPHGETCNKCHDELAFHGGSRRGMDLCIMCHTPQTVDPDTGNTRGHEGVRSTRSTWAASFPACQAGTPYQIIGFNQAVSDWSTVVLPSDPRRCAFCHESTYRRGAGQRLDHESQPRGLRLLPRQRQLRHRRRTT